MAIVVHPLELTLDGERWTLSSRCEGNCPPLLWYTGVGRPPIASLCGGAMLFPTLLRAMHVGAELDFRPVVCEELAWMTSCATGPLLRRFAPDLLPHAPAISFASPTPLSAPDACGSGTGMSCGLDSLAAARQLAALPASHALALSLLAHFDVGNHDALHTGSSGILYERRIKRAVACAEALAVPFVTIASNIDEWAPGNFARLHTVRNLSAAHLLSGRIRHYLYANGVRMDQATIHAKDTAYIDPLLVPLLSSSVLHIHQSTPALGAPDKIELIADWEVAHRFLNVCFYEDKNCGRCEKCLRRMLQLDAVGAFGRFAALFPPGALEEQRDWYLGYLLSAAPRNEVHKETLDFLRKKNYPHLRRVSNCISWLVRRLHNKVLRISGRPIRPL